ncbi:MAG: molecular chaperone DnaJ [Methanocalculus sp. MSAO_Arc1]|uniref:molecular chaperone DnaJ n=1 Tax=Methanocalculus TaxID=71151 RepID=UPI000FF0D366|nr:MULTISPECIES: molecular chaperone DnaJ [unclassified Methanocalculus]MCP1661990.1 molecular chaperone DnaJ [Methanocalculus sp. AMF5]RQD79890.1 MAG: molecular chaperone DnaJ [Methanocalculus sp. MSAO_Arc1]
MVAESYYEILGVPKNAPEKEIKRAYRNLARKYHPDVCKDEGAEERFKKINEAYSILSDADKRRQYDQLGHEAYTNASKGSYSGSGSGGYGFSSDFAGFGDIFDTFFGGRGSRSGPQRGADLLMRISVSLRDAVFGTDRDIKVMHAEACPSCDGTGSANKRQSVCSRCGGSGQMRSVSQSLFGQFVRMTTCTECNGKGRIPEQPCTSCNGSGHTQVQRTVTIHIPAGVESGMRLRMEGYGEAGDYGAATGDLYIEVMVESDTRFDRKGDTLETGVRISPAQAVLGSEVEIETIDNRRVNLKIPPGIQYGTALRIPGEGIRRRGRPGDLLVRVIIVTPKDPGSEVMELYEKIRELEERDGSGAEASTGKKGFFEKVMGR